jgi:hypothetical protein
MKKDINLIITNFKNTTRNEYNLAKLYWADLEKIIESLEKYYPSTLKQIWGDSIFNKGIFHNDIIDLLNHCNKIIEHISRRKENSELTTRNLDEWASLKETIQGRIDALNNIFAAFSFQMNDVTPHAEIVFSASQSANKLHENNLNQMHLKFATQKSK